MQAASSGPRIFRTLASELELTRARTTPASCSFRIRAGDSGNRGIFEVFSETSRRVCRAMKGIFQAGTRM